MIPLPPQLDARIHHFPRHAIPDQLHDHTQRLYVFIPALVVEKQHFLVGYARALVQAGEMRRLAAGIDFQLVKERYRFRRRGEGWRGGDVKIRKHFAGEVGGLGARCRGEEYVFLLDLFLVVSPDR